MLPQPLHPAVVHFPIVLAVLLPLAAIAALVVIRRGASVRGVWLPIVAVTALLAASAWVSVETGEQDEEAVEQLVSESVLHDHEDAAVLFSIMTLVALALAGAGLFGGRVGSLSRPAVVLAALVLLVQGVRVGHSGGELVYAHGAASAYTSPGRAGLGSDADDERKEDEHDERRPGARTDGR